MTLGKLGTLIVISLLTLGPTMAVCQVILEPADYTFTGSTQRIEWADLGTDYRFRLGKVPNHTSGDLFDESLGNQTSIVVSGLPVDGSTVYGRLDYFADGKAKAFHLEFSAFDASNCYLVCIAVAPSSSKVRAAAPFAGQFAPLQCGSHPTFSWEFGDGATSSQQNTTHSYAKPGLYSWVLEVQREGESCQDSGTIYIEDVVVAEPARITTPQPGSILSGASETFAWTPGVNVTEYRLRLGSSLGGQDIFSETLGSKTSIVVSGLPTDGRTIYARLESRISGSWREVSAQYQAAELTTGGPTIEAEGIVTANLLPTVKAVSPLGIFSVFGHGFSDQTVLHAELDENGKLARMLGGACLEMDGERLPLFAVTPTQINAQAPATEARGPASFTVIRNCDAQDASLNGTIGQNLSPRPQLTTSTVEMATVEEATPGFFLFPPLAEDGFIAARFNADNAAVAPDGMFTDEFGPSRPAKPGDIIVLYGTGWGETTANLGTGELAASAAELLPTANPMVSFGGIFLAPEDVLYVGVTPQAAGLYQLAIKVPANATPGDNEVVLTVYGKSTPVGPVVPITLP